MVDELHSCGAHHRVRLFALIFGLKLRRLDRGFLQPFGEAPSKEIRSRAYDSSGNTFDYVYELAGDTLTIWGSERGSPAYFTGRFSRDGNTNIGEWFYPGGGYKSNMTRITTVG